ncbi:hypothetical protein BST97_02575 [Nonlabens spongiae]|uniref:Outer membrane protein beta-barrel domain-containing protein n=2 Tax=Nonlabens spongiae TaxID=331648 RepID=A0A1W6MH82_9FLAO|nr:hypothetical protein BST97_02575 [Nonlabens spongiae]
MLLLFQNFCFGQDAAHGNISFESGFQVGRYIGLDFGINYKVNHQNTLHFGVSALTTKAHNRPEGYGGGLESVYSFGFSAARERLFNFRIGIGKIFNLNEQSSWRFHPKVGIGLAIIQEPINFNFNGSFLISENYDYEFNSYSTWSIHISPNIEYLIHESFGFSISPLLILNKNQWHYGLGLNVILGSP